MNLCPEILHSKAEIIITLKKKTMISLISTAGLAALNIFLCMKYKHSFTAILAATCAYTHFADRICHLCIYGLHYYFRRVVLELDT